MIRGQPDVRQLVTGAAHRRCGSVQPDAQAQKGWEDRAPRMPAPPWVRLVLDSDRPFHVGLRLLASSLLPVDEADFLESQSLKAVADLMGVLEALLEARQGLLGAAQAPVDPGEAAQADHLGQAIPHLARIGQLALLYRDGLLEELHLC